MQGVSRGVRRVLRSQALSGRAQEALLRPLVLAVACHLFLKLVGEESRNAGVVLGRLDTCPAREVFVQGDGDGAFSHGMSVTRNSCLIDWFSH